MNDAERNLYLDREKYRGWHRKEAVKNTVSIDNLSSVEYPEVTEVRDSVRQPEAPLPENFPTLPEQKQQKPNIPEVSKTRGAFSKEFEYVDPDLEGPGCGWKWHGIAVPKVDEKQLRAKETDLREKTQNEVNQDAVNYVDAKKRETAESLYTSIQILRWNRETDQHNAVYSRWQELNRARAKLKPKWDKYVKDHNDWINFDIVKENARIQYENDLAECEAQTVTETPAPSPDQTIWVTETPTPDPWDTESPEPPIYPSIVPGETPSPIITRGCSNPPEKPSILYYAKPAEPVQPEIPEGVTIPESWKRPDTAPTIQKIQPRQPDPTPSVPEQPKPTDAPVDPEPSEEEPEPTDAPS